MSEIIIDENHLYHRDGLTYKSVTTILEEEGFADVFGFMREDERQEKLDHGSYVHSALESYDKKGIDLSEVDIELKPYIDSWKKFLKNYKPEFISIEEKGICDSLGYGYTIDRVARFKKGKFKGQTVMVDIKTGGFYRSYLLQLAGYKYAWDENSDTKIDVCVLVSLNPYNIYDNVDANIVHWFNLVNSWNMKKKYL